MLNIGAQTMPPQTYLQECFEHCANGTLVWKARPLHHFKSLQSCEQFKISMFGKVAGTQDDRYLKITVTYCGKKLRLYAHRIIWTMHNGEIPEGFEVDHEDTNQLNNCISNLRLATSTGNNMNRSIARNNTSGVKGVSWDKTKNKWLGSITANRKRVKAGYFSTIEDACAAVKILRLHLHKNFANDGTA